MKKIKEFFSKFSFAFAVSFAIAVSSSIAVIEDSEVIQEYFARYSDRIVFLLSGCTAIIAGLATYLSRSEVSFHNKEPKSFSNKIEVEFITTPQDDAPRILGHLDKAGMSSSHLTLMAIRERIGKEIFLLRRRGDLNLLIGIGITLIGIIILAYYLADVDFNKQNIEIGDLVSFLPRLSLVFLIEIFAYFFLQLHKSSIREIKFFQNEITNVEFRLAALQLCNLESDEQRASISNHLAVTDRNNKSVLSNENVQAASLIENILKIFQK